MKALTLHQPWASLIAVGAKTVETRSWATDYRGRLAIHSAKRPMVNAEVHTDALEPLRDLSDLAEDDGRWPLGRFDVPLGCIVATAELYAVVPADSVDVDPFGDYSAGRWCWLLRDIVELDTLLIVRGRQRLWDLDAINATALEVVEEQSRP